MGWGGTAEDAAQFTGMLKIPDTVKLMPRGLFQHPYNPDGQMWYDIPNIDRFDFKIDLSDRSNANICLEAIGYSGLAPNQLVIDTN